MDPLFLANQLFTGLSVASILLLAALGLALTFGLMRVINLAHGEFLMLGGYLTYLAIVLARTGERALVDVAYVSPMLCAIGVSIAVSIVASIISGADSRSGDGHQADERDRDINRRGESVGGIFLGVAMVVPFLLAIREADHFWIANAMYTAFSLWAVVSTVVKLVAYRRGF